MGMLSYELRAQMRGAGLFGWQRHRPRAGMPAAWAKRGRSVVINCERDAFAGSSKTNQRRTKVLRWGALTHWQFRRVGGLPPHVVKVYVECLHRGQHVDFHRGRGRCCRCCGYGWGVVVTMV